MGSSPSTNNPGLSDFSERVLNDLRDSEMNGNGKRIQRLQLTILILVFVLVFGAFAVPITLIFLDNQRESGTQQELSCQIILSEIRTHEDLADVRRRLGLPPGPPIPKVPLECQIS